MPDFLTAVKSARNTTSGKDEDALLTAVGSTNLRSVTQSGAHTLREDGGSRDLPSQISQSDATNSGTVRNGGDTASTKPAGSPAEALQILRSQPSLDVLLDTLQRIHTGRFGDDPFSLAIPGPLQAQIINALITDIVPTFWPSLRSDNVEPLLSALRNITGLNAIVARLRLLATQTVAGETIRDILEIADRVLAGHGLCQKIYERTFQSADDSVKRSMAWKEFVNLVASGKVIGAVAQAEDAILVDSKFSRSQPVWLANGSGYCTWIGCNIAHMLQCVREDDSQDRAKAISPLLAKALHLGHSAQLLRGLLSRSDGEDLGDGKALSMLVEVLPAHSKRSLSEHLCRWLSSSSVSEAASMEPKLQTTVSATAGLLSTLFSADKEIPEAHLVDPALSASLSMQMRRACMAMLHQDGDEGRLQQLLEKFVTTFSSTLFIAHAPVVQQESLAQSILIAAGYVHRTAPMSLLMTARSAGHMQGVSNRLDSSNWRARWLGMVVGTNISKMVDKPGSQMEFGTDEMKSAEAREYAALCEVDDSVGTFESFQVLLQSQEQHRRTTKPKPAHNTSKKAAGIDQKPVFEPPRPLLAQTKIVGERVTELLDDDSEEEDDLKPYAKPDSDPEDSDEDATLVNRNKERAPVYIRDLMAGLRDDKNFDRFHVSIKTAAQLIRRKSSFGKEVTDHAEELAGMLCNLQDPFDIDQFDDMRLQALVAVLLSDIKVIAPLLSKQAFTDGYSIAQRCVILSALGLGGREHAGFKIEDEDYNPELRNTDFPSKKLPPRLHAVYSSSPSASSRFHTHRLEAASKFLEHQIIQPLALQAADHSTSHLDAVKVRTFSSRMDVEKARTKRKPPANELAKCFGETFFFPLVNRYQQEIAAYGGGSIYVSAPFVLVTFIKTLALLLHASGPATLGLPQISAEMWDLLLSLPVQAVGDISILQAVLFALLTLLETNTDKQRIAQEHPKQLMETQQWVDMVFERMGNSGLVDDEGKSEEAKVRALAAGVMVKCREIIEAYQKLLVGYDFT